MKQVCVCVVFVLMASLAQAQTHPCDMPGPTSGTATPGQMMTLSACHSGKDANGNTIVITGWALYDNATRTTPTLIKGTTSATSGLSIYTLALTAPATIGLHTYQLAAIDAAGESAKSSPFVLTVSVPLTVPVAPGQLVVQ